MAFKPIPIQLIVIVLLQNPNVVATLLIPPYLKHHLHSLNLILYTFFHLLVTTLIITISNFQIDEQTKINEALISLEGEHWKETLDFEYASLFKN
jgi:hypothetical protein